MKQQKLGTKSQPCNSRCFFDFFREKTCDFLEVAHRLTGKTLHLPKVDHLWAYFPKRDDGDIENSHLVDWILRPSTPLMLTNAGDLAFFDLKSALYPLFQVHCPSVWGGWDGIVF